MLPALALLLALQTQPEETAPEDPYAGRIGFSLDAELWFADLSGTSGVGYPVGNVKGELDLRKDLFLTSGNIEMVGVRYAWPGPGGGEMQFGLGYQRGRWTGSGFLQRDISLDGDTFAAGTPVRGKCRHDIYAIDVLGLIPMDPQRQVHAIVDAQVGGLWSDQWLWGSNQRAHELMAVDLVTKLGLGVRYSPLPFVYGEAVGGVGLGEWESLTYEFKAALGLHWKRVRVEAGYRYQNYGQFDFDATLDGFFVGVAGDF